MEVKIGGVEEIVVRKVANGLVIGMTAWEGQYVKILVLTPDEQARIKKSEEEHTKKEAVQIVAPKENDQ